MAKRGIPGIETVALKTPEDLEAARDLVGRHGSPSPLNDAPTWRMLVAPAKGIFQLQGELGEDVEAGVRVGIVQTGRDEHEVVAPYGGTVVEWLVEDGDPVSPGQPLVRLHPVAVPA